MLVKSAELLMVSTYAATCVLNIRGVVDVPASEQEIAVVGAIFPHNVVLAELLASGTRTTRQTEPQSEMASAHLRCFLATPTSAQDHLTITHR